MTTAGEMERVRTAAERATRHRQRAVLLVGSVDRRLLPALRFAAGLVDVDVRALHVSVDPEETRRLAREWMHLDLTWMPLHIREGSPQSLLGSICRAVAEEVQQSGDVTVILPEVEHDRWWSALLHRRSARHIAGALTAYRQVTTVIVPYFVPAALPRG